jgi:hypothetical protein
MTVLQLPITAIHDTQLDGGRKEGQEGRIKRTISTNVRSIKAQGGQQRKFVRYTAHCTCADVEDRG